MIAGTWGPRVQCFLPPWSSDTLVPHPFSCISQQPHCLGLLLSLSPFAAAVNAPWSCILCVSILTPPPFPPGPLQAGLNPLPAALGTKPRSPTTYTALLLASTQFFFPFQSEKRLVHIALLPLSIQKYLGKRIKLDFLQSLDKLFTPFTKHPQISKR